MPQYCISGFNEKGFFFFLVVSLKADDLLFVVVLDRPAKRRCSKGPQGCLICNCASKSMNQSENDI